MTIQEQILVDVNKNLTGINQSLYHLASDINKLIKKVYEEDKKVEKRRDKRRV
jgi:peptidoglycan hydrolase CwlO-like protein